MLKRRYIDGDCMPDEFLAPRNSPYTGAALGIIVAEADYAMLPGNVANASSYPFPVFYEIVDGVSFERVVAGDPDVVTAIIESGQTLVDRGVRAIVGACGSFANYQQATAEALDVPVFLSSMLQVPWILSSFKEDQKLLVVSAVASALTDNVFRQCGIDDKARLVIEQATDLPAFAAMLSEEGFNPALLESQLVEHARHLVEKNPMIGAILLQCSDLPPFAAAIQDTTGLPVFDTNTLLTWINSGVARRTYNGTL